MPPRMTTQSAGRATAAPQGGRTGRRTGRGGGRTRGRSGDQGNGRIDGQGGQVVVKVVRNVIMNNNRMGCCYKEFLACNPKKYVRKGVAIVYTRWIKKMDSVQDMSGIYTRSREATVGMSWEDFKNLTKEEFFPVNEMQKLEVEFWNHAMVGAGHVAYTDRFHELARTVQKAGTLTDKAVRNGSLKKNPEKRRNGGEPNRDRNVRDENKRARIGNAFATTTNPVRREYNGTILKCVSYNLHHSPKMPCRACFNCGCLGYMAKDCRVAPRMVNLVNAKNPTAAPGSCYECGGTNHFKAACPRLNQAQRPWGNHPNQVIVNNRGQGRGNNDNHARGRAFMLGAEEARQDPNIVTGTFTLNDHYATTLFDSGANFSFISTTFIPLLGIEPSELGFSYEIEIASGQLVEINKVIRGCKLEIEGHMFDINLIPFGSGSFDVILGMA
ncbi:reverse transcriptase domain-containing protein [Tanacetum coccineum]